MSAPGTTHRPRAALRALAPALLALALVSLLIVRTSQAAFTATVEESDNAFRTGAIELTSDGPSSALFDVTGLAPGESETRCVTVTYTGTVDPARLGTVRLYSAGTESQTKALADTLTLEVDQGTGATDATCTGFTAGSAIVSGTFSSFLGATTYAAGLGNWTPTASNQSRSYRFVVTLPPSADDSVKDAELVDVGFVWELRTTTP